MNIHAKRIENKLPSRQVFDETARKIEYEGYRTSMTDAEETLVFTNDCFVLVLNEIKKEVKHPEKTKSFEP